MNTKLKATAIMRLGLLKRRFRVYVDPWMLGEGGEDTMLLGYRADNFLDHRPEHVYAPYIPLITALPDPQVLLENSEFARWLARQGVQRTERHIQPRFLKVYKGPGYPTDPKLQEEREHAHLFSVLPW